MFGEVKAVKLREDFEKVVLNKAHKQKLKALNKAFSDSNFSNKSTYASTVRYFVSGAGIGSDIEFEAMLAHCLAIQLAQVERMALAPLYLGSLL